MNLQATIQIYAGGPGSGCQGPNCGRPALDVADAFEKINKVYKAVDAGRAPDREDVLNANYAARDLLQNLMQENRMYMFDRSRSNRKQYVALQNKYTALRNTLLTDRATLTDLDQAVNVMHVDYNGLYHWVAQHEEDLENQGLSPKKVQESVGRLEKMAEYFQEHRLGAIKK